MWYTPGALGKTNVITVYILQDHSNTVLSEYVLIFDRLSPVSRESQIFVDMWDEMKLPDFNSSYITFFLYLSR